MSGSAKFVPVTVTSTVARGAPLFGLIEVRVGVGGAERTLRDALELQEQKIVKVCPTMFAARRTRAVKVSESTKVVSFKIEIAGSANRVEGVKFCPLSVTFAVVPATKLGELNESRTARGVTN